MSSRSRCLYSCPRAARNAAPVAGQVGCTHSAPSHGVARRGQPAQLSVSVGRPAWVAAGRRGSPRVAAGRRGALGKNTWPTLCRAGPQAHRHRRRWGLLPAPSPGCGLVALTINTEVLHRHPLRPGCGRGCAAGAFHSTGPIVRAGATQALPRAQACKGARARANPRTSGPPRLQAAAARAVIAPWPRARARARARCCCCGRCGAHVRACACAGARRTADDPQGRWRGGVCPSRWQQAKDSSKVSQTRRGTQARGKRPLQKVFHSH